MYNAMALEAPADRERARGSPLPGSQDRRDRKQAARLIEVMAYSLLIGRRHMRSVLVNGRAPRPQSFCAWCCEPIGENYLRELATNFPTAITIATSVTAGFPTGCSKGMYRPVM